MKVVNKILLIFIIILTIYILYLVSFVFKINGDKNVTINYGEEYVDEGATLHILSFNKSYLIQTINNVDNTKIGSYEIVYFYNILFLKIKKTRTVNIVDKEVPILELYGDEEVILCPTGEYHEEGFYAYDNYDLEITDKVEITNLNDSIKYLVKDSSNNITSRVRKIVKMDNTKPSISLKGGNEITVKLNNEFIEPGYNVYDNCDEELSVNIKGNVDTNKVGDYELIYEVIDKSGNTTELKRIIHVKEDTTKYIPGVIYLTFDDGPSGSFSTTHILDVLKKYNLKATFFVTGSGPDYLIKREYDEGHSVAIHTNTHIYSDIYSSVENYFNDLNIISNRIKSITGVESKIIRFPGGSNNTVSNNYNYGIMNVLRKEVLNRGYSYFDWNVDSQDAGICARSGITNRSSCVYNYVTNSLSKNRINVVLMHDIKSYTAEALESIIIYALNNNYSFEVLTLSSYPIRFS